MSLIATRLMGIASQENVEREEEQSMEELEVTWSRAAIIWWSIVWRMMLYSMLAGGLAGFLLGITLVALGMPDIVEQVGQLAGMIVGIPIGIWVIKTVLTKEYRQYRIALVPSREAELEALVKDVREGHQ